MRRGGVVSAMRRLQGGVLLLALGCSSAPAETSSPDRRARPPAPRLDPAASASAAPAARGPLRFNRRTGLPIQAAVFSPDGSKMVTLCGPSCDKDAGPARTRVLLWSLPDLTITGEVEPNKDDMGEGVVYSAELNADGSRLAISTHNEVTLWRTSDLTELARVGVPAVYGGIEFSPDGKYLATTGVYGNVIVLDASSGAELLSDALHNGAASYSAGLRWTKDSRRLYAEGNANVGYFEPHAARKKLTSIPSVGVGEGWIDLSVDQRHLMVTASQGCAVRVLATASLAVERRFEGKAGACTAAFSPTSDAVAVVRIDGSVEVVPLGGARPARVWAAPEADGPEQNAALSFSPDGRRLFWRSGRAGGVWNLENGAPDAAPLLPNQGARWRDRSVLEVARDEEIELFDVDKSVIVSGEPDWGTIPAPFVGLRAVTNGDLELKKAGGASLLVRVVFDGGWQVAILDPAGGRAAGSASLLASDAYDATRGGGVGYELDPDLARSFFRDLRIDDER